VPAIDFDGLPAPRPRKNLRLFLGVGTIAAVIGISSTLASDISLNGGIDIEFAQGVVTTAACDGDMTITPVSQFVNATEGKYLMTSIRVSDVDLTPEGWDFQTLDFHTGFTPGAPSERSWDPEFREYAGQYKKLDGTWENTCEGKVLMLRAYTSQSDFAQYTVSGTTTSSPLWLNRIVADPYARPANVAVNAGVGIRLYVLPPAEGLIDLEQITDFFNNDFGVTGGADFDPLVPGWEYGTNVDDSDNWSDSTLTIFLNRELASRPPVDSRWVNKITIESSDTKPSGWGEILNRLAPTP
jgi:hypothetical protein